MPRGRRRTELAMLAFAVALVLFAYASVGLSMTGRIPAGILGYGLAFALLMLLAHLAIRWLAPWADPLMLPLAATSTAGMIRRLGGSRWQMLHRLVYLAAVATVVHTYWPLTTRAPIYAVLLGILFFLRVARARDRGRDAIIHSAL